MFPLRSARGRMAATLVLFVLLLVAISVVAVWSARDHQSRLKSLEHRSQAAIALESARSNFYLEGIGLISGAFVPDPRLLEATTLGRTGFYQDLAEAQTALEATGDTETLLLLEDLTAEMEELEGTVDQALSIVETGGTATAMSVVPQVADTIEGTVVRLQEMADGQRATFASERDEASRAADSALWALVVLASGAFVLAAGVALGLTGSVIRPLASLRAKARAITAGGSHIRAEVSGPEEIASLARDFNEMTEALSAKTKEYIDTTNLTGDIIARLDKDGRWTFLNDGACRFYGKPREELLGTNSRAAVHPEDLEVTAEAIREARATKELVAGFVNRQITPKGTRVVEWNGYALFDEEGQYAAVQITGRDITERRRAEQEREGLYAELEVKAITDSLTGLYDHTYFYKRLAEEIERSKRYEQGFTLLMMDVDDFRRFNDSRGHQGGDELLRFVAYCIRKGIRDSDLAFRYGGDEFAAILVGANSSSARAVVKRINRRITERLKQTDDEAVDRLSLSAGVACFPDDGTTPDDLVRIADAGLRQVGSTS